MGLPELCPNAVFRYFADICHIPHGSGNTGALGDYCMKFAGDKGLSAYRDAAGNVMIFKDGTPGYENSAPVILQGHLDMVCDKTDTCDTDMLREGIRPVIDGAYIRADGTTLGADDGIAVAYILAVLESDSIAHPPIEALLTVDEEIGMIGASNLDASRLQGKMLINIDSEKEGILTASCAGGIRVRGEIPILYADCEDMDVCRIAVSGLRGGHSGIDIAKGRKNGIKLLGRLLEYISRTCEIRICALTGGSKENAIPSGAWADVAFQKPCRGLIEKAAAAFFEIANAELHSTEPQFGVSVSDCDSYSRCADAQSTKTIIFALIQVPDGVQAMSPDIPDMVQTSMNLGIAALSDGYLILRYLIRSNAATGKQKSVERLVYFIEYFDGHVEFSSDYPAWEYRTASPLRDIMVKSYEEMYADKPEIQSIHAGLECGILASKITGLDMISFGPTLESVHTPQERMHIDSAARCWHYLIRVLTNLK